MKATCKVVLVLAVVLRAITAVPTVFAEESSQVSPPAVGEPNSTLPEYLKDRGTGVATSIFAEAS